MDHDIKLVNFSLTAWLLSGQSRICQQGRCLPVKRLCLDHREETVWCEKIRLSPCTPLQDLCGQGSPKSKVPIRSLNAKTKKFTNFHLRDSTIVPDVTMVGERVGDIAQLALLCILCKFFNENVNYLEGIPALSGAKGTWCQLPFLHWSTFSMFVVQRRPQKELLLNLSVFAPGNLNDNMEGGVRGSVWDVVEWRDWPWGVFQENLWQDWT